MCRPRLEIVLKTRVFSSWTCGNSRSSRSGVVVKNNLIHRFSLLTGLRWIALTTVGVPLGFTATHTHTHTCRHTKTPKPWGQIKGKKIKVHTVGQRETKHMRSKGPNDNRSEMKKWNRPRMNRTFARNQTPFKPLQKQLSVDNFSIQVTSTQNNGTIAVKYIRIRIKSKI